MTIRAFVLALALAVSSVAQSVATDGHWVTAWGNSEFAPFRFLPIPSEPDIKDKTIRMVLRPTIGGEHLRVRLSNAFGTNTLTIGAAHIALTAEGSKIVPGTDRAVTFGGMTNIKVPAGAPVLSDPVDIPAKPFLEISISIYLPLNTPVSTWHVDAKHESYVLGPGNLTGSADLPSAEEKRAWFFLSSIDIWAPSSTTAIVAFGDSITAGAGRNPGAYIDWPNQLAKRLSNEPKMAPVSVVNEGIPGNRILNDAAGVSALARFDRDVLSLAGVRKLIVLLGVNDIGFPRAPVRQMKGMPPMKENPFASQRVSADDIIAGLQQVVARAHEHGIKVFGATLTPYEGSPAYDIEGESIREEVNKWIRTAHGFDEVFDWDAILRDPNDPLKLRANYDSGDHIHPSALGYATIADSIPLAVLRESR